MPEERVVDVLFRGLPACATTRFSMLDEHTAFVEHEAPLPVGSRLVVRSSDEGERETNVVGVVELEQGGQGPAGMKLAWGVPRAATEEAPASAEEGGDASSSSDNVDTSAVAGKSKRRKNRRTGK